MRTYYIFQSDADPTLCGVTDSSTGARLPTEDGPWTPTRQVGLGEPWPLIVGRTIVDAGLLKNGFLLWRACNNEVARFHPIIESDRVEVTDGFNMQGTQIGTIGRLLIGKISGRVLFVDVTFGGFLGIGVHHRTIPWD